MNWQEKLNGYLNPKRQRCVLIGLLIIYAFALTYKINEPFMRMRDDFDGVFGVAAWNWIIHGPIQLKFEMMTLAGTSVIGVFPEISRMFFLTHPQFFIAPTAFIYWLFGVGEWQTRAGPILFSLFSLILFWKLIARVFKTSWLTATSSFFYAFFPMSVFFGSLLTNDYFALFFILALFLAVITFEQERQKKYLFAICAIIFLGGLSDWTFIFAAAAAWWYIALAKNYPQKKLLLLTIIGILVASLSITLLQIWDITNINPFEFLKAVFLDRNVAGAGLIVIPRFLNMRLSFDLFLFSEIGLILAIAGAMFYLTANKKDKTKLLFLMLLAGPGLLTYLVFYNHSAILPFYGLYIMPAIALLAGYGIGRVRNAWYASSIFLMFLISCIWYASILFAYTIFAPDDFALFKRANAILPISASICLGDANTEFYLTPSRKVDLPPCPDYSYFILRKPLSFANIYPLFNLTQTFQIDDFWQNARRISFSEALGAEIIKSIPPLKQKIDVILANRGPRNERIRAPKIAQAFIDQNKLKPIDCSTNFCLYEKK